MATRLPIRTQHFTSRKRIWIRPQHNSDKTWFIFTSDTVTHTAIWSIYLNQRKEKKTREVEVGSFGEKMDDSGAILCQISSLKDMLDQVNEEIEANIQSTREIESEIAKCSEIETSLAMKESELMKMKLVADFEINSLIQVSAVAKSSVELLEKELSCLRMKLQESNKRIADRREAFIMRCNSFQSRISNGENEELLKLLKEKESLQSEKSNLNMKHNALRNSTSAFAEEILEELHNSNMALQVEIQLGNVENEKLLEDIDILKRSLVSLFENHLQ